MRKRHTAEQIAQALRQAAAGTPIADIIRKMGVHENTVYLWKKKYGGLGTSEIRELRQLREENTKLKKAYRGSKPRSSDASGDRHKKTVKPAQQRDRAGFLVAAFEISARRACRLLKIKKSTFYYKSHTSKLNTMLAARIKDIATVRVRYGYSRIHVLLRREGFAVNRKRVYRLYALQGFNLRPKMPHRKRAAAPRSKREIAINQMTFGRWTSCMSDLLTAAKSGYERSSIFIHVNASH